MRETIPKNQDGPDSEKPKALHIWVLNSGIFYSSSRTGQCKPAIKLLYRRVSLGEANQVLESITCDAQELNMPAKALNEIAEILDDSNMLLPVKDRLFKQWRVGLLPRWHTNV